MRDQLDKHPDHFGEIKLKYYSRNTDQIILKKHIIQTNLYKYIENKFILNSIKKFSILSNS